MHIGVKFYDLDPRLSTSVPKPWPVPGPTLYVSDLKVHKIENFFGSEFEFYTISLLVMLKYSGFVKKFFWLGHEWGRYDYSA